MQLPLKTLLSSKTHKGIEQGSRIERISSHKSFAQKLKMEDEKTVNLKIQKKMEQHAENL